MLLQFIVAELDRELYRLHAIRKIVAGLSLTSAVLRPYTALTLTPEMPVLQAPMLETPRRPRKSRADLGQRPRPKPQETPSAVRALATQVPAGPVVFNPARLAEERARREETRAAETAAAATLSADQDMDALTRDLAARWSTGLVQ